VSNKEQFGRSKLRDDVQNSGRKSANRRGMLIEEHRRMMETHPSGSVNEC
jgi:hypothetical protein